MGVAITGCPAANAPQVYVERNADAGLAAFFDEPWPSDERLIDGHPDLRELVGTDVLAAVRAGAEARSGFSPMTSVYFRLSRTPKDETVERAIRFAAVEGGADLPVDTQIRAEPGRFWSAHALAIRVREPLAMEPGRQYVVALTRELTDTTGVAFSANANTATQDRARATAATRFSIPLQDVVAATVFTTGTPTDTLDRTHDWYRRTFAEPPLVQQPLTMLESTLAFSVFEGTFGPVPQIQAGTPPFFPSGGEIVWSDGAPTVREMLSIRFALSVPNVEPPGTGFPIVVYGHGTGGDARRSLRDLAARMAAIGVAVLCFDQIHHGDRNPDGSSPELTFFNLFNPLAARDNLVQASIDYVAAIRFAQTLSLTSPIAFRADSNATIALGHSQGALTLSLAAPFAQELRAIVYTGPGALIARTLVDKTTPVAVRSIVAGFVGVNADADGFSLFHPVLSFAQTMFDPVDPIHFANRVGALPLLMVIGDADTDAPPAGAYFYASRAAIPACETNVAPYAIDAANRPCVGRRWLWPLPGNHFVGFAARGRRGIDGWIRTLLAGDEPRLE